MMTITTKHLAEIFKKETTHELQIQHICTDSRKIQPNSCFFALPGEHVDGHNYIDQALAQGAVCAVSQKSHPSDKVFYVPDVIQALGQLAKWYRSRLNAKVIAITGSAGKTTTREIIYQALSKKYCCHRSPKSFNNHIGLPLTLLAADLNHEIIIVEIGANAPGEILELTHIAQPDIAMVTNIHPAHLEGFGGIDTIIQEKASICKGLKDNGIFLINGNFSELLDYCRKNHPAFISFGQNPYCDIQAYKLYSKGGSGSIEIEGTTVNIPLPGMANLENVLAAWAVCKQVNMTIQEFAEAVCSLESPPMRLQIETIGNIQLINDCYNANLASMANALECLHQIANGTQKRTVFLCGYMAELGSYSKQLHQELGKLCTHYDIHTVLAIGPEAETVINACNRSQTQTAFFKDTKDLCNNLHKYLKPDDILLVKGSRCNGLEQAVSRIKELFGSNN